MERGAIHTIRDIRMGCDLRSFGFISQKNHQGYNKPNNTEIDKPVIGKNKSGNHKKYPDGGKGYQETVQFDHVYNNSK
jgi:hypothetical protein